MKAESPEPVTVEVYERMFEDGRLTECDRVELIEGVIVRKIEEGIRHRATLRRMETLLERAAERRFVVRRQSPVTLPPESVPEPDLMLLKYRADQYEDLRAERGDLDLIIEISEGTFDFDDGLKRTLYADQQLLEYWIVDLTRDRLLVYRAPEGDVWGRITELTAADSVTPLAFPGLTLEVAAILAP